MALHLARSILKRYFDFQPVSLPMKRALFDILEVCAFLSERKIVLFSKDPKENIFFIFPVNKGYLVSDKRLKV